MRHASLFSGIGGPEVAAAMLGWENVFHCEINGFGRKVLEYWFPDSESYEDITKTDFTKFRGTIKAYGNAIVPQVMYRIFEAIEAVENKTL